MLCLRGSLGKTLGQASDSELAFPSSRPQIRKQASRGKKLTFILYDYSRIVLGPRFGCSRELAKSVYNAQPASNNIIITRALLGARGSSGGSGKFKSRRLHVANIAARRDIDTSRPDTNTQRE